MAGSFSVCEKFDPEEDPRALSAALRAIDVAAKSVVRSIPQSLAAEKEVILRLADTEVSKNLIRVFFCRIARSTVPAPKAQSTKEDCSDWLRCYGVGHCPMVRLARHGRAASGCRRRPAGSRSAAGRKSSFPKRDDAVLSAAEAQAGMDRIVPVEGARGNEAGRSGG